MIGYQIAFNLHPSLDIVLLLIEAIAFYFFYLAHKFYLHRYSGVTFAKGGRTRTIFFWEKLTKNQLKIKHGNRLLWGGIIDYPKTLFYLYLFLSVGIVLAILPFVEIIST